MKSLVVKNGLVKRCQRKSRLSQQSGGFTLVELLMVMAISVVICAFAVPNFQSTMMTYRLGSAASAISGAVQSTRYQAINAGCTYQLALTSGSTTYQVSAQTISGSPPACSSTYSNVGSAVPWSTTSNISLNQSVTFTFNPNGTVTSSVSGTPQMTISTGNYWKQITVSGTGYVTIQSQ